MKLIKAGLIILLVLLAVYQSAAFDRAKDITDNTPIITSKTDEIEISCQYEKGDLLKDLTAYDVEDGYITDKILIGGFSNFTKRGVSSLDYAVYDSDGNIATFSRKVIFSDYTPPKVTTSVPWAFKATDNPYNIPTLNVKGTDMLDGDISKHVLLTADIDYSKPGSYPVSVLMKNSFGDEVSMELPVHILDPGQSGIIIELTEPFAYVEKEKNLNPEGFIAAVKNEYTGEVIQKDGYELTVQSNVDTSKDGIYEIHFSAVSEDKYQRGETWLTVVVGNYGG